MSIGSKGEHSSSHRPVDQSEDSVHELSCDDSDQDSHKLANHSSHMPLRPQLPPEIWTSIAQHAFFPTLGREAAQDPYFIDGQPDLTLMKVNRQLRQIFQKSVLPNSLMILVRRYNCKHYPYADEEMAQLPYTRFLASGDREPWVTIAKAASVVSMRVLCSDVDCSRNQNSYTVATLYSVKNKVNILTLSHLIMQLGRPGSGRPVIGITCDSKSIRGAQLISDFLKYLTSLVGSTFPGSIDNNQNTLLEMRKFRMPWSEGTTTNESFFRATQLCLDDKNVPIDKMIMTAINFSKHISLMFIHPIHPIDKEDLPSLIANNINGGCALSTVLEGLSEYILHHSNETKSPPPVFLQPKVIEYFLLNLSGTIMFLGTIVLEQKQNTFRPWQPTDIPFLIHYSAIMKTIIRFQIILTITALHANSSETILKQLLSMERPASLPDNPVQAHLSMIDFSLEILLSLATNIDALRGTEQSVELREHDDRQIFKFVDLMQQLTTDIEGHFSENGKTKAELLHDLTTMIGRERYRIPVVEDLDKLYETFDSLRQGNVLRSYYFLD